MNPKYQNPLYERLILAFFEKASISHDGLSVHSELKKKYVKSNLPNPRTFQRFLDAETLNPRDGLLGYMAAYILEIHPKEVEMAEKENTLGDYFMSFLENPKPRRKFISALSVVLPQFSVRVKSVVQKVVQPEKKILVMLYVVSAMAVIMFVYILFVWFK